MYMQRTPQFLKLSSIFMNTIWWYKSFFFSECCWTLEIELFWFSCVKGILVYVTQSVEPSPASMKEIIQCAGGQVS